jgi:hypothetical protein
MFCGRRRFSAPEGQVVAAAGGRECGRRACVWASRVRRLRPSPSVPADAAAGRWAGVKSVDRAVEKVVRSYGQVRTGDGARDDRCGD